MKAQQNNEFFNNQIVEDEYLLTKVEIAKFLNVSVKMIDRKVYLNEIPYLKIGRLVRFSKLKILAWADENNSSR
jgi:excisionase family DNA binding protein